MAGHRISNRSKFLSTSAITLGLALVASNAYALDDLATPTGEVVVGGAATFDRPSEGTLNVNQSTDRVVIDWDSFNIGGKATTEFFQPNSGSLAVNRVMSRGSDPTQILGTLKANGQVMVLDRNGVLFGANSKIDVGGIVASTGDVDNAAVMNGDRSLTLGNFGDGAIVNNGSISVSGAGLAAFVAPTVVNNGVIIAKLGKVALAAGGETATVDLYGDGLVELSVAGAKGKALAENAGTIEGASVAMTASAAKDVVDTVINMHGVIKATTASEQGGKIVLGGGSSGKVSVTGTLDASGTKGGSVSITGHNIEVNENALIAANGTEGDGGNVRLYADNYALFEGKISARGGAVSGNGGFVETSGANAIDLYGDVDASAANGTAGLWLIDPRDLVIDNSDSHDNYADAGAGSSGTPYAPNGTGTGASHLAVMHLNDALNAGTNVYVTTVGSPDGIAGGGDGSITINANIAKTSGGNATLTMNAAGNLGLTAGKSITSTSGFLGVNLTAAKNIGINGTISSNGGNIVTNAGQDQTIGTNGVVDAAGGNISLHQNGILASAAGAIRTSGAGTITLNQNAGGFIQKAINALANTGTGVNTINIGAGTYAQDITINQANVTLNGAQAGVAGDNASRGAGETVITPVTNGIHVLANNATIDGFTVNGGLRGVYVSGADNATIKNTIVTGSQTGVSLLNAGSATLTNNVVHGVLGDGYYVSNSASLTMTGNSVYDAAGNGINLWQSEGATLTGNYVGSTTDGVSKGDSNIGRNGILISSSDDAVIKGNTVQQAKSLGVGINNGIYILGSNNATVGGLLAGEANTVKDVTWDGIKLDHADNANVIGNSVDNTGRVNIYANYATNSTIDSNTVTDANLVGAGNIWVNHGSNNTVSNNDVSGSVDSGIQANDVVGLTVKGNTVTNTDGDGISILNSDDVKVRNNIVAFSGNNGIHSTNSDTVISGNQVYLTGWNGIYVEGGETATISKNLVFGAGFDGISVQDVYGIDGTDGFSVKILDNKIALTQRHGIDVENASATKIDGNQIALAGTNFEGWLDDIFAGGSSEPEPSFAVQDEEGSEGDETPSYEFTLNWGNGDGIHVENVSRNVGETAPLPLVVNTDEPPTDETPDVQNKPAVVISNNDIKWTGGDGIEVRDSESVRISNNTVDSTGINSWTFDVADIIDQLSGLDEDTVIADGENALFGDGNLVTFLAGVLPTPENTGWGYSDGIHVENVGGFSGSDELLSEENVADDDFVLPVRINGNTVTNSGGDGIEVRNSGWSIVHNNTVDSTGLNYGNYADGQSFKGDDYEDYSDDAGDGIRVSNAGSRYAGLNLFSITDLPSGDSATRISGNTVSNTGDDGIEVYDVDHSVVKNNTVTSTGSNGILVTNEYYDDPTTIIGNTVTGTDENGIKVSGVDKVRILNNLVSDNDWDGIYVIGANNKVTISGNTVWNSDENGIETIFTNDTSITGNYVGAERPVDEESSVGGGYIGWDGIHSQYAGTLLVDSNVVSNTDGDGIYAAHTYGGTEDEPVVTVSNNTVTNAGWNGIELADVETSLIDTNTVSFDPALDDEEASGNDGILVNGNGGMVSFLALPGDGFTSDITTIRNNTVTNAPVGGIVVESMDKSTLTGNVVTNSGFYGVWSQGGYNNNVILAGNTLTDNPVGGRFESGNIDLTGATNTINGGNVGLQFDPAQIWGVIGQEPDQVIEFPGSEEGPGITITVPGMPIFGYTAASLNLVNNTIGTTAFTGQSTYYVELRNGALFAPDSPTIENGLNASYDGFSPASVGGVLTQVQYDHLESMFQHYRDDNTLGLFFFGLVPNDTINQDDIFDFFDGFNGPTGRFSITILGLPKVGGTGGGGAGGGLAGFLAGINPAAGGDDTPSPDDLADITPAAGGNANNSQHDSQDASCWSQAMQQASSGATVNYSFGGSMEESLSQAAACGQGAQF